MWIPLFGWYAKKQRMIPVDRGARGKVMVEVLKRTRDELSTGRQLIIYPEGTRRPPGAEPVYKYGIARMYRDLNLPVVPVAMHPGLFWPRRTTIRYPGHFKVRILPAIQPGMDPDAFFAHLIEVTERASDELLLDTVDRNPHLPLPPTAVHRLAELRKTSAATG
jgi:1-acyl-sn-glycerol-3-phosphate acyltransferase